MAQNAKISVSGFYWFCKKKNRENDAVQKFSWDRAKIMIFEIENHKIEFFWTFL